MEKDYELLDIESWRSIDPTWIPTLIPGLLSTKNYGYTEFPGDQVEILLQEIPTLTFYNAWCFLAEHPCVYDKKGIDHFEECLSIGVCKRKATEETEVWLEFGYWVEEKETNTSPAFTGPSHDTRLDTYEPTFEQAVVSLARKITLYYGTYNA